MSEFGNDFVTVIDEDGEEFELELIDVLEHNSILYHAFIPAGTEEDDEDVEIILLKAVEEDGEELLATLDSDEEVEEVYNLFMQQLFDGDDE